jgi:hypothetical protein
MLRRLFFVTAALAAVALTPAAASAAKYGGTLRLKFPATERLIVGSSGGDWWAVNYVEDQPVAIDCDTGAFRTQATIVIANEEPYPYFTTITGTVSASPKTVGGTDHHVTGTGAPDGFGDEGAYLTFDTATGIGSSDVTDASQVTGGVSAPKKASQCGADTTPPVITLTTPSADATYTLNQSVLADFACVDLALASCAGTVADGAVADTASVGPKSFAVTATDATGNTATQTVAYDVEYALTAFARPISTTGLTTVKAGQTVPVTWRVLDANAVPVTDPSSFVSVTSQRGGAGCHARPSGTVETDALTARLRYLRDGWWQYDWRTAKAFGDECRTMTLTLAGGQTAGAAFWFRGRRG